MQKEGMWHKNAANWSHGAKPDPLTMRQNSATIEYRYDLDASAHKSVSRGATPRLDFTGAIMKDAKEWSKRKSRAGETKTKIWFAHFFYRILSLISPTELSRDIADFRLLSREVVDVIKSLNESNPYFRGLVNWVGFRRVEVEYDRDARFAGHTKYTWRKMLKLATSGVTSFSEKPLYISSFAGLLVMASTTIAGLAAIVTKVLSPNSSVPGYLTILISILFLGGLQLLSTGILGIYLGIVNQNSKSRPRYIVAKSEAVGI